MRDQETDGQLTPASTQPVPESVADYSEHFVAFIDVLGYKELVLGVEDAADALAKIRALKSAMQQAIDTLGARTSWQRDDLDARMFSDSIIIAVRATMHNFDAFFQLIAEAQANLMRLGILVRGGLAIGRHFGDETIVFSEGLVKAYTLESTVARHPRIIVPKEFWDFVVANGHDEDIIWFRDLYTWQDPSDGRLFVDYLNFMPFTRRDDPHHDGRDLRNHKDLVIDGLTVHREKPGVLAKFQWLAVYHNQWCSDQYPTHPELLL